MKKTKEQFVAQANDIWHGIYDYSESNFQGSKMPITIYCPRHDYYFTLSMAQNHVIKPSQKTKPTGCPYCSRENGNPNNHRLLPGEREQREREKAERQRQRADELARQKAERQRRHEEEKAHRWQAYQERLQQQKEQTRLRHEAERAERQRQKEEQKRLRIADLQAHFCEEAPRKQGEGYIYKGIEQITTKSSTVLVHCPNPDHDWHPMRVDLILQGCKCRECAGRHQPKEQRCADFIRKSVKKYKDAFDYSRVPSQYMNNDTQIEIRCTKHNYWYKVTPDTHLRKYGGCPICNYSKGETAIYLWLEKNGIKYEHNSYRLPHNNIFCQVGYLVPDFWLPEINTIIEYNGEQHYEDVAYFRREKNWNLDAQQERDRTLREICRERGIRLIEISYEHYDEIPKILEKSFSSKK